MDQEADAGDDQQHDQRKLIEDKAEIDVEAADVDPGMREGFDVRQGRSGQTAAGNSRQRCVSSTHSAPARKHARGASSAMVVTSHLGSRRPRIPFRGTGEGQQRNQPEMRGMRS